MDSGAHRRWVAPGEPWIVVAVRPGLDSAAGLRFAAYEALDRRCPVRVLHVLAPDEPGAVPQQSTAADQDTRSAGVEALRHASLRLRAMLGDGWPVSTELAHGSVERVLAEAARGAQMVVVQQEPAGRPPSPLLDVVAGLAQAPLVVVPAAWRGTGNSTGLVVVGVDDPVADAGTVRWALADAERSGAQVRVVHSWWSADLYDQPDEESWPGWDQAGALRANLERALYDAVGVVTTVPVEVLVEHGDPRTVLAEQAEVADLVVIGRRDPETGRPHLGPVARSVVHASASPVVVVAAPLKEHLPAPPDTAVGSAGSV